MESGTEVTARFIDRIQKAATTKAGQLMAVVRLTDVGWVTLHAIHVARRRARHANDDRRNSWTLTASA